MTARPISADATVLVVGAGVLGAGIAQLAALAGQRVLLYDQNVGIATHAIDVAARAWQQLVEKGTITETQCKEAQVRLTALDTLPSTLDVDLVIEATPDDRGEKAELFAMIEARVSSETILASSSSTVSVTALAANAKQPHRVLGLHFFDPVPRRPLVEVVSSLCTAPVIAARAYATMRAWGKVPIHVRSTPGFIVNRVLTPVFGEAWRLLQVDAVDAATLDAIMVESGGFSFGPCRMMDSLGHDQIVANLDAMFAATHADRRYQPSLAQREIVVARRYGEKSGRGIFRHDDGAPDLIADTEAASSMPAPSAIKAVGRAGPAAVLLARLAAHGVTIDYDLRATGRSAIVADDMQLVLSDGRSASQIAFEERQPNTVVFDLALDFSTAKRIALSKSSGCSDFAYNSAVALLQRAGYQVSRVGDVPGLPVASTVAVMLNEAADAVFHNVASMSDCDTAMKMGMNFPLGPFEWGQRVGIDYIVRILKNLHHVYGDDRYRVSPLLQHKLWTGKAFYG